MTTIFPKSERFVNGNSMKKMLSQTDKLFSLSEHRSKKQVAKALAAKKEGGKNMKIVVVGGTGLIGSRVVTKTQGGRT